MKILKHRLISHVAPFCSLNRLNDILHNLFVLFVRTSERISQTHEYSNPIAFPDRYFYLSLRPVACIVIRVGCNVCVVFPITDSIWKGSVPLE